MIDINEPIDVVCIRDLRPGDLIVLKHPGKLTQNAMHNIKKSVNSILPDGCNVIVLPDGMEIDIMRYDALT